MTTFDYNKPAINFDILGQSDDGRKKVIAFKWNGNFYRQIYKYGKSFGFKFIEKYPSEIAYNQGIFGNSEQIYSSTLQSNCTDEGKFLEYSLQKLNK